MRLGRAGSLAPDQARFLDMAHRNLDRLALIIDDLLDLSKIEAGRIEYRFTEASVGGLIEDVVATFRPQAEESGIELAVRPLDREARCLIDPDRLAQVLSNLVGNALKFTEQGGRVGVAVHAGADDLVIEVSDTGAGIEPDEIQRIFEPFHQAGDCLTRSVRGTGLGLSIARELAWAHGGELSVESAAGEGSRFRVHLPADLARARELVEIETGAARAAQVSRSPACSRSAGPRAPSRPPSSRRIAASRCSRRCATSSARPCRGTPTWCWSSRPTAGSW